MEVEKKMLHFKRLFEMDAIICDLTSGYLKGIYESMTEHCQYPDGHETLGSVAEGTMLARNFFQSPNNEREAFECLKLEHDVELIVSTIHENRNYSAIEEVPGKPGYVRLNYSQEAIKNSCNDLLTRINSTHFQTQKLSSQHLVDETGYLSSFTPRTILQSLSEDDYTLHRIRDVLEYLSLNEEVQVTEPSSNRLLTKASCMQRFDIFYKRKITLQVAYDHVIAIKLPCELLPKENNPVKIWLNRIRSRFSPEQCEELQELTSSVHVIAKPSESVLANEASTEWRISFARVEKQLAKWRSPQQNFVYFIFKSIFYMHLKAIEEEFLTSYLCKTSMLWFWEKHHANDELWNENTESTVYALVGLVDFLKEALKSKSLQYYFIPEINLIKDLPDRVRLTTLCKLEAIARDVDSFIPAGVQSLCDRISRVPEDVSNIISISMARTLGRALMQSDLHGNDQRTAKQDSKIPLSSLLPSVHSYLQCGYGDQDFLKRSAFLIKETMFKLSRLADVSTRAASIELD